MPVRASIKPLVWESDFFGLQSGLLVWDDNTPELTESKCAAWPRLQAKISASNTERLDALQQLGFRLVEGEADFAWQLPQVPITGDKTRSATEQDISQLRAMASRIFSASRFRAPWYQPEDSGRFYAQWVENAVRGTFDNECLIIDSAAGPAGFVTLRILSETEARIGLLAGKGQGAALMNAARGWCLMRGITTLRVATQSGNLPAMRRYISSGASLSDTAYWLYR